MTNPSAKPVTVRSASEIREAIAKATRTEGDCLIWDGGVDKDGYPKLRIDSANKVRQAHRLHWEQEMGAIPEGAKLSRRDVCPVRKCIAPAHLVLGGGPLTVPRSVNCGAATDTTFRCGHGRTLGNTLKRGGCRRCRQAYVRRYNATRPGRSRLIDVPPPASGSLESNASRLAALAAIGV